MKNTIQEFQSIFDMAIQSTGNVENSFDLAINNGLSISDLLEAGQVIDISEALPINSDVRNNYNAKKIQPATGSSLKVIENLITHRGVGYMQIERSFKVF